MQLSHWLKSFRNQTVRRVHPLRLAFGRVARNGSAESRLMLTTIDLAALAGRLTI